MERRSKLNEQNESNLKDQSNQFVSILDESSDLENLHND